MPLATLLMKNTDELPGASLFCFLNQLSLMLSLSAAAAAICIDIRGSRPHSLQYSSIKVTIVHPDALFLHEERNSRLDYQHMKSWHLVQQEKHLMN
ncbi:hypothetical protein A2U01_0007632 [Trifolium medium]|uniref:Uncharacterized protein n=1 Tax=Trifolium medium TaxID=97028 RepID=A0A392MH03_9FABA|nr:hypothetical protein [Trifolium medium]